MHRLFDEESQPSPEEARIAELEQLVGRQALELEILKKSIANARWSVQQKREVVMKLTGSYPIRMLCQLLGVPRSSVYYQAQPVPDAEAMLKAALLDLAGQWPTYGYRRLTAMMRRLDWPVNGKRVRRWLD